MNLYLLYRQYILCLFLACLGLSCCSQNKIEEERKKTMIEIVNAFSKGDAQKLYTLIDTGFCFSIDGKSSFIRSQQKLYSVLSMINPMNVNSYDYTLLPGSLNNTTSYEAAFYITTAKYDSIKFRFDFNQDVYRIAYYVKTLWHPKGFVRQSIIKAPG